MKLTLKDIDKMIVENINKNVLRGGEYVNNDNHAEKRIVLANQISNLLDRTITNLTHKNYNILCSKLANEILDMVEEDSSIKFDGVEYYDYEGA